LTKNVIFLSALAIGATMQADTFTLPGGAMVTGPVIKESPEALVVDLGFEILRIPADKIISRSSNSAKEKPETTTTGSNIYTQQKNLPTRKVSDLVGQVAPATVQVTTPGGQGSGFIISEDGYLVTNNHVISGENDISIILYEKGEKELRKVTFEKVELIAQSPLFDLALLKIHAGKKFPSVPIAPRNVLDQGQEVFAVGSPLGLERTISQGIVSVKNRVVSSGMTLIQHTAQINPGNSGGPLFNRKGEVVGVNNLKISGAGLEGIGFAIPSTTVIHFIESRNAYAFDPRNPNAGYRYLSPAGSHKTPNRKNTSTK